MRSSCIAALIAVAASWPAMLLAQTKVQPEPVESVPLVYQSSFSTYRMFKDEPVGDWRKLNVDVADGGMSEAAMAASPSLPVAKSPAMPNTMNHGTHEMKKDK